MSAKAYFGFKTEPFIKDIATRDLLPLPSMLGVKQRLEYCENLGGVLAIFGDVESGKTTALRWGLSDYHPSQIKVVAVVATTGSNAELYKQVAWGFDLAPRSGSRSALLEECKNVIKDLGIGK